MVSATIDDATDGHCTQPARYMPLTRTATSFNKRLKLAEAVLIQVHAKEQERLAARKRQQQGLKSEMTAVPTPTPSSASTAAAIVTIASETCGLTSRTRGLTPVNCSLNTSGLAELKAASLTISDAASLTVSEAVRLSASDTTCLSASDTTCLPTSDAASLTSDGARLASDTSSCASNSCSPCSLTSDIDCLAYGSCSLDALDALRVELLVLSDDDLQLAFYEREQRGRGIKAIAAVLQRQYPDFYISSKTVRETMDYADIVFNTSIAGFLSTDLVSQCECCYAKVPLKFCECPRCCSILEQQGGTYENCGQHQSSDSWEQLDTTSDGKFIKFRHRAHPELIVPIPIHDRSRNSLTAYQADCRQRRKRALERHLKAKKLEGNESTQGGTYENCGQHQSSDSWEQLDTTSDGKFIKFRHRAHPELIVPIPIHDRSRNSLTAYQADCRQRRKRALERHLKAKKLEGNESTSKKRPGKQSEKTAASKAPRTAPVLRQRCWSRPNETEAARRDRIRAEAGSRTERLQTDRQRDLEISSSQQELCTKRGIVRSQLWPPRATSDATPSAHLDRCACAATAFYLYPPSLPLPHLSTSTPPLYLYPTSLPLPHLSTCTSPLYLYPTSLPLVPHLFTSIRPATFTCLLIDHLHCCLQVLQRFAQARFWQVREVLAPHVHQLQRACLRSRPKRRRCVLVLQRPEADAGAAQRKHRPRSQPVRAKRR